MYLLRQHVSKQQSTQCKFNLTVTRLVQPLLTWKSKNYWGVSLALGIQHALSMRHIVISGLSGSTLFFHII
jgi:hypothetical protein